MKLRGQLCRAWVITAKDMRTYYLKPPLISWGILFPTVMALVFYLRSPDDARRIVPGLVGMTVLFGATSMEAVVIAFEKRIGAMERLLIAPVATWALVLGKATSGMFFGTAMGFLVWVASLLVWGGQLKLLAVLPVLILGSWTFACMGVVISLMMREVFDAMAMANVFRFPMVFLGGVFTPLTTLPGWLRIVATFLPLSYVVDALTAVHVGADEAVFAPWLCLLAIAGFGAALYLGSVALAKRRLEDLL